MIDESRWYNRIAAIAEDLFEAACLGYRKTQQRGVIEVTCYEQGHMFYTYKPTVGKSAKRYRKFLSTVNMSRALTLCRQYNPKDELVVVMFIVQPDRSVHRRCLHISMDMLRTEESWCQGQGCKERLCRLRCKKCNWKIYCSTECKENGEMLHLLTCGMKFK